MISMATTGERLRRARAFRRRDGRPDHRARGALLADHKPLALILAILISAVFRALRVSTSSEKCLAAQAEADNGAAVADKMSKLNWNWLWKKRIAAAVTRCRCRRPRLVRLAMAPA